MKPCPKCKIEINDDASTYCDSCGYEFPELRGLSAVNLESNSVSLAGIQKNVASRYRDAYLVAKATTGIGSVVKGLAIFLAAIVVIVGIVAESQTRLDGAGVIGGLVLAVFWFTPLYILGILVSAQGQILKASLDSAVNTSTFLDNEQRAKVMSLV